MNLLKFAFLFVIGLNVTVDISHKILLQNIAFKIFSGAEQVIWISVINALLILPFLLLFSTSGFISDKFDKVKILQFGSLSSFTISLFMVMSYMLHNFYFAMFGLFLLGVQAAIYSPAKFGLIKLIYSKEELSAGNAHVQVISIVSLLFTMGIFSFLFENVVSSLDPKLFSTQFLMENLNYLTTIILFISLVELISSFSLLKIIAPSNKDLFFDKKELFTGKLLISNIKEIKNNEIIFLSVIGLSVFWGISQGMMAVFPAFAKAHISLSNAFVVNVILAVSGIGIAVGSFLYSKFSKHYIDLSPLSFSAFGITICIYSATLASSPFSLGFIFFLFGVFGGMFIVPLNALLQYNSNDSSIGTILAGNNWFQSLFMFSILCLTTVVSFFNFEPLYTIYLLLSISLIGSFYVLFKLPESLLRFFVKVIVGFRYKLEVYGLDFIPSSGSGLLLGNHVSWLDWAIIQLSIPRRLTFVMDKSIYNKWFLHWFLKRLSIIPINASSKDSLKLIASRLDSGDLVVLFPEGAITRTGHLGEFKKGFEKILSLTTSPIPVHAFYIRGLWETMFSRANKKFKDSALTNVVSISFSQDLSSSATAALVKKTVLELSNYSWKTHINSLHSIPNEIISKMKQVKKNFLLADSTGLELSGHSFLTSVFLFKNLLKNRLFGQNIGLLVPSSAAGAITNAAVLMLGKTIININYTSDLDSLKASLSLAQVKSIIASRQFITKLKSKGMDISSILIDCDVIYLEDLKPQISLFNKIFTLISVKLLPACILKLIYVKNVSLHSTAFIMFSSGSEGTPKGVELSHANVLGNVKQTAYILNVNEDDVVVGSLPLFHAFGISVTTFLPLIEGVSMIAHPDPTDGLGLAKLVFKYKATIMCGTSTFFRLYTINKKIHPSMFASLRYVVAGAEKLNPEIKSAFKNRFGKDILEGYGTTETAPVATCNIPEVLAPDCSIQTGFKEGSVGMPVPGTSIKIVDPESFIELPPLQDGMILVSGIQVMEGYLFNPEKSSEVLKVLDGQTWYVTGDKGHLDEDGFLFIVDRYSRFAKLGGEMISLSSLESKISSLLPSPDIDILSTNIPDDKKGEKIVLFLSKISEEQLEVLKASINSSFDNKLMIPSVYKILEDLPKLGSGKKDFKAAKTLALSL